MKKLFTTLLLMCGMASSMANAESAAGNTYLDKLEGLGKAYLYSSGCTVLSQPGIGVQYSYLGDGVYRVTYGRYDCPPEDRCRLTVVAYVEFDADENVTSYLCNN